MTSRSMLLCASLALLAASCGRNTGLTVKILTPPDSDPFSSASMVTLSLLGDGMSPQTTMSPVSGGKFNAQIEISSPSRTNYVYLKIEATDGAGKTVARGRSPLFMLPDNDFEVPIYAGRPGLVTATSVRLPDDTGSQANPIGRRFLAGATLRGRRTAPTAEPSIGALIVGGLNDNAQPLAHAWRYSPGANDLVDSGTPQIARYGAVLVPSANLQKGHEALLWGGADATGKLLTNAEKFDPQVTDVSLVWKTPDARVAEAGPPGAYAPAVAEVKDSVFLISGGSSQPTGGTPVNQAVVAQRTDVDLGVARVPGAAGSGPMAAARFEHSASPVMLLEGSGALLFGGLSMTDRANKVPVAEVFLADKSAFQPFLWAAGVTPPESRRGHVAVTLRSGKVLVAGGYQDDDMGGAKTVFDSALLIDPGAKTFSERLQFLRMARYGASINLLAQEVLICGGFDQNGAPLANCELFNTDDRLDRIGEPTPLPHARAGHLALPLDIDQVVLVGGVGDGQKGVAPIDIYTLR